jgi:DNA polymerase III delta prime subunit
MDGIMRYSPGMKKLTVDTLRILAQAQGLELTDAELTALLPLVEGGRKSLAAIRDLPVESEPASQFRVF